MKSNKDKTKKLFLASSAFQTLDLLLPQLSVSPQSLSVAFIPTAGMYETNTEYQDQDREALGHLGFKVYDLEISTATKETIEKSLTGADMIFVAGGNTFVLLQELRRTGADRLITQKVFDGCWFVGSSAGSVVTGPDIAPVKVFDDPTRAPKLKSTTGLGLVNFLPLPHWRETDFQKGYQKLISDVYFRNTSILPIRNNQAILITDDKMQLLTSSQ